MRSLWKKMLFMVVVTLFCIPGMIRAFGPGSPGDGPPPVPPFIADQYDADGDGQLSEDEQAAAREAFIEQFDTDGDGEVSRSEMRAVREAEHNAFIEKYDTDGDGEVSEEERAAAWADFIELHDTDGDGELSSDELPPGEPGRCGTDSKRGGGFGPRQGDSQYRDSQQ